MKKKFSSWDKVCELREFKALRVLPSKPNIISLLEAFLIPQTRELYFVFEYMEGNLYQLIKDRKGKLLNEKIVQSITFQILEGLYHIHSHGIFHRDMKPENILISTRKKITCECDYNCEIQENYSTIPSNTPCFKNTLTDNIKISQGLSQIDEGFEYIVKLGDFGLAREIKSKSPYTDYVSTRWYRAPEVLLRSNYYSSPIDLWAVGTILAELCTLKPLFPGQSEIDQLFKISEVLGSPNVKSELAMQVGGVGGGEWKEGVKLAKTMGFSFPQNQPQPLSSRFTQSTPPYFLEFLSHLLRYDPRQRLTALDSLKHPYFAESNLVFADEPEEIRLNRGIEKKKKNDNFLFRRGGHLIPGDKKNNTRYSWTKATDGQNNDNNGPVSQLPPLDIEAANNIRQKDFVLPTIKAISPFSSDKAPHDSFGERIESIEQSIVKSHQAREHETIKEEKSELLSIIGPYEQFSEGHLIENSKPIPIMLNRHRGEQLYNCKNDTDFSPRHQSNPSKSFQFPHVHKRNRSNTTSEIDRMIKDIEEMNRGFDPSQVGCISPKTVDLRGYKLPDDVMKFFGTVDDSSSVLRRSCSSRSRDFMKIHRRYSSTSATREEMSPMSLTFQHHKEPSVASSQDHSRNDSGFSTNSTNNMPTPLEDEKETPSYVNKVYGQHLKTWQQICQENGISSHNSPLDDDNFSSMINDSFKSPVIPEFQFLNVAVNSSSQDHLESPDSSPTSTNNSFFSNLKAAVKSHTVSPTKRYGIFSSNNENLSGTSTLPTQQSTQASLKLRPRIQRRQRSNSGDIEGNKEKTKNITKKRSFIFDSISSSANSYDGAIKESSSELKRTNLVGGIGGEKKDKKLSSSPGLFATLGAKIVGGKGGGSVSSTYSSSQYE